MKECLTAEEVELLDKRELRGKGLVKALRHLESCPECRSKMKSPTREEILRRLEPNDHDAAAASVPRSNSR